MTTVLTLIPARVRQLVVAIAPLGGQVADDATLDALRFDSIDRVALACELDEAFRIDVPDDDVAEWRSLADVIATVARLTAADADVAGPAPVPSDTPLDRSKPC